MRRTTRSTLVCGLLAAALLTLAPGRAGADCVITGPAALCGGAAQLCGPTGNYAYEWAGPNGFFAFDRCITVTTPGSYFLMLLDMTTGAEFGPCIHDLAPASTPVACSISGPTSVCAGGTVELCGPNGDLSYAWSGPGGFTATSRCVTVGAAGTYSLAVRNPATGCPASTCDHNLSVVSASVASITGPGSVCAGSSVELCGPDGNFSYAWSGPGGFSATSRCVTVGVAGTYSLAVSDPATGCPASTRDHNLSVVSAPVASITGPGSVCAGSGVELCGPDGNFSYAWSGPGGFSASTTCASVSEAGTYQLVVRDATTGCESARAQHDVQLASCRTIANCPRPVTFWIRQCSANEHAAQRLSNADLAALSASVDEHSAFFNWAGDSRDGFCATVRPPHSTLALRAARQFAGVWANVCAGDLGVARSDGHTIALTAATPIALPGVSTTVGEWLAATDAALIALEGSSPRDAAAKAAYRRIVWLGWHVNHGLGIGSVCGGSSDPGPSRHAAATLSAGTNVAAELLDEEPITVEMADDEGASLQLTRIQPNPFANSARVGFIVVSSASKNVSIGVYDLTGRLVHSLASGAFAPGAYEVRWDGSDVRGGVARNGIYFVLGRLDGQRVKAQITLLR